MFSGKKFLPKAPCSGRGVDADQLVLESRIVGIFVNCSNTSCLTVRGIAWQIFSKPEKFQRFGNALH